MPPKILEVQQQVIEKLGEEAVAIANIEHAAHPEEVPAVNSDMIMFESVLKHAPIFRAYIKNLSPKERLIWDYLVHHSGYSPDDLSAEEREKWDYYEHEIENTPEGPPPEIRAIWNSYSEGNRDALTDIIQSYKAYEDRLMNFMEKLHPTDLIALKLAKQNSDIDEISHIMEKNIHLFEESADEELVV